MESSKKNYFGTMKKSMANPGTSHFGDEKQMSQFQSTQGNFMKANQTFGTSGFDDRDESELSESNNELYQKHLKNYYENNNESQASESIGSATSSDLSRTQGSFATHSEAFKTQ